MCISLSKRQENIPRDKRFYQLDDTYFEGKYVMNDALCIKVGIENDVMLQFAIISLSKRQENIARDKRFYQLDDTYFEGKYVMNDALCMKSGNRK